MPYPLTCSHTYLTGWAMYVLFLFYHACAPDMAAARPLGKFLTIKAVVFLSFWQV